MQDFIYKHKRKILIVGILVLIVILVISIINVVDKNLNSVTVNITVSPLIAKVKIGDKEYNATDTVRIRPGTYRVEAYADGFITKTGELVAVENETVEVTLYLDPTEENSDWYSEHVWDSTARGDIISDNYLQDFDTLKKQNPILNYVPYNTYTYTINYENGCAENGGAICLVIDAEYGFRRYAVEYLQQTGEDLSLYSVKIKGQNSPFSQVELNVPSGLSFAGASNGLTVGASDLAEINSVLNAYFGQAIDTSVYLPSAMIIKNYDNNYYGVLVAVSEGGASSVYDSYRMVVGRVNGKMQVLTNADVILSQYKNPALPGELLKLVDEL